MDHVTFEYDREGDILTIAKRPPYAEQETEELGDDVLARMNPDTGEIEILEVLFFANRLKEGAVLDLPLHMELRRVV